MFCFNCKPTSFGGSAPALVCVIDPAQRAAQPVASPARTPAQRVVALFLRGKLFHRRFQLIQTFSQ
jgi:hypothetical protein